MHSFGSKGKQDLCQGFLTLGVLCDDLACMFMDTLTILRLVKHSGTESNHAVQYLCLLTPLNCEEQVVSPVGKRGLRLFLVPLRGADTLPALDGRLLHIKASVSLQLSSSMGSSAGQHGCVVSCLCTAASDHPWHTFGWDNSDIAGNVKRSEVRSTQASEECHYCLCFDGVERLKCLRPK